MESRSADPRATHYRRLRPGAVRDRGPRPTPANALGPAERQAVLDALHRPRHADLPPGPGVSPAVGRGDIPGVDLDDVPDAASLGRDPRPAPPAHPTPPAPSPQLLANAPNEVWSWDLTKLPGPGRHEFYDQYAVIDIFSRYVPDWLVAPAESAELAEAFIAETIARNGAAHAACTRIGAAP